MICEECNTQGLKSRVYPVGPSFATAMGVHTYYDEEGVYHCHDPNRVSTSYSCSNGHTWGDSRKMKCPVKECEWNDDNN